MNKSILSSFTLALSVMMIIGGLVTMADPEFGTTVGMSAAGLAIGVVLAVATWRLRVAVKKEDEAAAKIRKEKEDLYLRQVREEARQAREEEERRRKAVVVRASSRVYAGGDGFAVAGVTFRNEDGSSRQEILREICAGKKRGQCDVVLEPYEYKELPAIRIVTPHGCVGNVRQTDVEDVTDAMAEPYEAYIEVNSFIGDDGKKIYRADLYVDAE